jgi:hypothetical protein
LAWCACATPETSKGALALSQVWDFRLVGHNALETLQDSMDQTWEKILPTVRRIFQCSEAACHPYDVVAMRKETVGLHWYLASLLQQNGA